MGTLVMIGQLMLSLSILIILHELGHFLPARWFKTRVEKFYLFFDPWFHIAEKQIGETRYGLGWLPLGGYVKIAGMIDESMDKEQLKQAPQPWEFRSKPAWQRLIIMLGGVTVNFILGFALYAMVLWVWGEDYLPAKEAKYGIAITDSLSYKIGLQDGDNILSIGNKAFDKFNPRTAVLEIAINGAKEMKVQRNGETVTLPIPSDLTAELTKYKNKDNLLFEPRIPLIIGELEKGAPAEKANMKVDDRVIGVNGQATPYYIDFKRAILNKKSTPIKLSVLRNDKDTVTIDLTTTDKGKIGVGSYNLDKYFKMEHQTYSLGEAIPAGFHKGWDLIANQIKAFKRMFSGDIKVTESLGGFGSISKMYGTEWVWERFWQMTATLSLILGFMNLLPIPALDGGYVMFLIYEVITGRKPSEKFMEYAITLGFIFMLSLMLLANGLDIFRGFFSK